MHTHTHRHRLSKHILRVVMIVQFIIILVIGYIAYMFYNTASYSEVVIVKRSELDKLKASRHYNEISGKICDYMYTQGSKTCFSDVKELLVAIDKFIPMYFFNKEFNQIDFYTLALVESGFNRRAVGKHGEVGFFQILRYKELIQHLSFLDKDIKKLDPFNTEVNTSMACFVLAEKYGIYKNYKDAFIAYNGYIKGTDGKVIEKYWRQFNHSKKIIKRIINGVKNDRNIMPNL